MELAMLQCLNAVETLRHARARDQYALDWRTFECFDVVDINHRTRREALTFLREAQGSITACRRPAHVCTQRWAHQ